MRCASYMVFCSIAWVWLSPQVAGADDHNSTLAIAQPSAIKATRFQILESAREVAPVAWVIVPAARPEQLEKPPLSETRILGELLLGTAVGMGGGIASFLLDEDVEAPFWSFWVGATLGSSLAVYAVGSIGNQEGSYLATFVGSALGATIALWAFWLVVRSYYDGPEVLGLIALPAAGGLIGFNVTRRYETPPEPRTALIDFRDGQTSFALPTIYFRANPFDQRTLTQNVDLVAVRF